jgi:hypothetical protein
MPKRWLRLLPALAVLLVLAAAGLMTGGAAHAANPVPKPAALANHPYVTGYTGTQIRNWGPGTDKPGNCTANTSELGVTANTGYAKLSTTGATGDCTDLELPSQKTTNGYVYEIEAYFSNYTQWDAYWMFGENWPQQGEIDAVEGGSGTSFLSYHYQGPSGPAAYSTCNNTNGCDGSATPIQVGPSGPNITPGWHTIDISYGGHGAGQGEVCDWYDGQQYGCVYGSNVLDGGTDPNYQLVLSTGSCNATGADVCGSAGQTSGYVYVDYLHVFS